MLRHSDDGTNEAVVTLLLTAAGIGWLTFLLSSSSTGDLSLVSLYGLEPYLCGNKGDRESQPEAAPKNS
jgi:hypothetical protein